MDAPKGSTRRLRSVLDPTTFGASGGCVVAKRFRVLSSARRCTRAVSSSHHLPVLAQHTAAITQQPWRMLDHGAGFAFIGSFLSLIAGALLGAFSLLTWPLRVAWRLLRRRSGISVRRCQEDHLSRPGRFGPSPYRTVHAGRQAAESLQAPLHRQLYAAAHHVSLVIARGMVHICDGRQSG